MWLYYLIYLLVFVLSFGISLLTLFKLIRIMRSLNSRSIAAHFFFFRFLCALSFYVSFYTLFALINGETKGVQKFLIEIFIDLGTVFVYFLSLPLFITGNMFIVLS